MDQPTPRPYRQVARAAATERTQQRIVEVFLDFMIAKRLDEITLDAVAAAAQTTRQTVIRMFGGKGNLLTAAWELAFTRVTTTRRLPPGPTSAQVARALVDDYEDTGDMIIRFLFQEEQYPELKPMLEIGRAGHRAWITETFARSLDRLPDDRRAGLTDELVAVTDVYLWKLFRRDFGREAAAVARLIEGLIDKVLAERSP